MAAKVSENSAFVISDRGRKYVARRKLTAQDILDQAHAIAASRFNGRRPICGAPLAKDFLIAELGDYDREVAAVVFLDLKLRIIAFEKLFFGTLNKTAVYPREVARRALHHNAHAIILAHNHPSGDPTPSIDDERLTDSMRDALSALDVKVLDHIVVGGGRAVSLEDFLDERRAAFRRRSKTVKRRAARQL
jgi:DNA repair protein RadC